MNAKLEEVEAEIKQARTKHNAEEVAALRKEEEQLRKKEEQLRYKEEQLRTEKLLLLQRQPGTLLRPEALVGLLATDSVPNFTGPSQRSLANVPKNSVPTDILERLTNAFERLASRQEPVVDDTTDASLGEKTLQVLQRLGTVHDFEGDEAAGPAALDAAALQDLADCQSESELVKYLTPVLWRLCLPCNGSDDACGHVLVNSENFRWLDNLGAPLRPEMLLKPDLFEAPRVCVKERAGTGKQGSGDCFIFGGLAHRLLQSDGCVRKLFEGKLVLLTLAS